MWHLYFSSRPIFFFKLSAKCMLQGQLVIDGDVSTFFVFLKDLLKESCTILKDKLSPCALLPLKCSFRLGSATNRNIIWHLKSTQQGWEASGAALAFAGPHKQRTQLQSALLCALLNSNDCAHILQSLASKKPVCADQGLKPILAMLGLWNYSLFIPCTCEKSWIILSQQESQSQWFSIGLSYSGMSAPVLIVMYTCCNAGEKKRAGSHEKYLNNDLSKGFFFLQASTWVPFCAAMLKVSPQSINWRALAEDEAELDRRNLSTYLFERSIWWGLIEMYKSQTNLQTTLQLIAK